MSSTRQPVVPLLGGHIETREPRLDMVVRDSLYLQEVGGRASRMQSREIPSPRGLCIRKLDVAVLSSSATQNHVA